MSYFIGNYLLNQIPSVDHEGKLRVFKELSNESLEHQVVWIWSPPKDYQALEGKD